MAQDEKKGSMVAPQGRLSSGAQLVLEHSADGSRLKALLSLIPVQDFLDFDVGQSDSLVSWISDSQKLLDAAFSD